MYFTLPANNFMIEFEKTLTYLLTPVGNSYWFILEKAMKEINLHSGQVFILISLFSQNDQSQIELAKNLNLSPPTINKMVKNLIDNDIVKMRRDENDGRIVRVNLTEKGFGLKQLIEEQWLKVEAQIFLDFSETERLIMFQLVEKLRHNLDSDNKDL